MYSFDMGSVRVTKAGAYYHIWSLRQPQKKLVVHHSQVYNFSRALDKVRVDMENGDSY